MKHLSPWRRLSWLGVCVALLVWLALTGLASAQSKSLFWERFDFDITILSNGDIRIVETQTIVFTSGSFTFGTRGLERDRMSELHDVQVSEGGRLYEQSNSGRPYTFQVYLDGSEYKIKWFFPPTQDTTRTYTIAYTVSGALRYYPNGDQLWWTPIVKNRSFPVNNSRVVVHLPEGAAIQNYDTYGARRTVKEVDARTVEFTTLERIPPGEFFEVRVEFTPGVVAGAPAPWQEEVDRQMARLEQQERLSPVVNLITLMLSIVVFIGGMVGLYILWYTQGRDKPVGFVADYLAEPPSDLPPGVAGTLLDEQADIQDVVATIVDLARRGVVSIEETEESGLLGIGKKRDFVYRKEESDAPLRLYEQTLLAKFFAKDKKTARLSEMQNSFYTALPTLKAQLYDEVVKEGFFSRSPETTRNLYAGLGIVGLIGSVVGGLFLNALLSPYTPLGILLVLAFGAFFLGLTILARYMPRKLPKGVEAAARWNAFKRYLANIEKYTKLDEAKDIFDKYLPYAIAFGLDKSYVRKFAEVKAPAPDWYYPVGMPYGTYGPYRRRPFLGSGEEGERAGRGPGEASPVPQPGGREGAPAPSLDRMADSFGRGLDSMSQGLGAMLDAAASTLSSRPRSSSSSGRSGGFRGGGWSGGGSFGGGGGGGGRGSAGFG